MFPAVRNNDTSLTCQIRVDQVSAYCRIVVLDMKFDVKVATAWAYLFSSLGTLQRKKENESYYHNDHNNTGSRIC